MKDEYLQYFSDEIKKGTNISEVLRALIFMDKSLSSHELSELVEEAFPSTNSELLQAIWHWEGKKEGGITDNKLDLMGKHYIQI
ncbi:hypothetical protein [Aliikangiella maris]|uniref:DUF494 domain-containing protein n=2 Tax=Aliikangiella maris TaxID=3162458 RepID=A0ABV3MUT1_9GAMM